MEESQKPWDSTNVFDWYENEAESTILIPIDKEGNSISVVEALGTIYEELKDGNIAEAEKFVVMLAELIVGAAMGIGKSIMNDMIVNHQIGHLDEALDKILSENAEE